MRRILSITISLAIMLLLLGLTGGAGYRLGYGRGLTDSAVFAAQLEARQDGDGQPARAVVPLFYRGYYPHPLMLGLGWGFSLFGAFFSLLFFLLLAGMAARLVCGRRMQRHWHNQPPAAQTPAG